MFKRYRVTFQNEFEKLKSGNGNQNMNWVGIVRVPKVMFVGRMVRANSV